MKIGFIGLGNMGYPMVENLIKAGKEVHAFDVTGNYPDGAIPCSSAGEVSKGKDIVITMLPSGAILSEVANEIIPIMDEGSLFADCSTIEVDTAIQVSKMANESGLGFIDAPVSGGSLGAKAGTLTFMVGGEETAFARIKPLLEIMGGKIIHCGPSGSGQAAKMCNNMILGATMIVTCEAYGLARKLNLDREVLFEVVSQSSGYSWSNNVYCPLPGIGPQSPADNDYKPGFSAALMLKDLLLSQKASEAVGFSTEMGAKATDYYSRFCDEGNGDKDFSSVILPMLEK
ncbi:MAG: 3-hydroxyisobutyrate dehydrogenase [Paracoccaceae bacterium]|nr:3-hydroxyisobutyrate dehydrogenase [Paracoccaceae bacterium]